MMQQILISCLVGIISYSFYKIRWFVNHKCYLYRPKHESTGGYHVISSKFTDCLRNLLMLMTRCPRAYRVVGMDCEFTSESAKGGHPVPAILQLATPDMFCAIFQLKVMENNRKKQISRLWSARFFPTTEHVLSQVLEDATILKVGVGIAEDTRWLEKSYGMFCKGWLDLRYLADQANCKPGGLNSLAEEVLGKNKVVLDRKEPWEQETLPLKQLKYAKEDACLSVEIFMKLNEKVIEKRYGFLRRLFWTQKDFWHYTVKMWENYIGKPFKLPGQELGSDNSWLDHLQRFGAIWYPLRYVHLESTTFSRSCAVCGKSDMYFSIISKAIIPADYDLTPPGDLPYYLDLCEDCLEESREVDYHVREQLVEECGAPLPDYKNLQLATAKAIAKDILFSGDSPGEEWVLCQEQRLSELLEPLEVSQMNYKTLEIILAMDVLPNSAHGRHVRLYYENYVQEGTNMLKWLWCYHFLKEMRPRNLPLSWRKHFGRNCFEFNWPRFVNSQLPFR